MHSPSTSAPRDIEIQTIVGLHSRLLHRVPSPARWGSRSGDAVRWCSLAQGTNQPARRAAFSTLAARLAEGHRLPGRSEDRLLVGIMDDVAFGDLVCV